MKKSLCLLLALCVAASCAGCAWMEGSYVSIKPHQVGYRQGSTDRTVVSSHSQLRSAITGLVDAAATEGIFTLTDYPEEEAVEDTEAVIQYVLESYPTGAYAVEDITFEYGQNLLSVEISYRRSKTEIDNIRSVRGIEGAKAMIAQSLSAFDSSLTLQIAGYTDTDFVQYIADYAALNPQTVMELPQVSVQVWPEKGSVRIVELVFSYQTSRESLRYMATQVRQVFSSARLYVASDTEASVKLSQLYSFLMERYDYSVHTSITPAYSLLCYGVGDSRAFAQVYAAMCRQSGLEVLTVSGTRDGESRFWNIVRSGDRYYHVDLLECARRGAYLELADSDMASYVWDYDAYPACGQPTEPTDPTGETG